MAADSLEAQARGFADQANNEPTWTPAEPTDAEAYRGGTPVDGTGGMSPKTSDKASRDIETPAQSADEERIRQEFHRDYTRKSQANAELKRQLEEQLREIAEEKGRLKELRDSLGNANKPDPNELPLDRHTLEQLGDQGRASLELVDQVIRKRLEQHSAANQQPDTSPEVEALRQRVQMNETQQRWAQESAMAAQKYGEKALEPYAQDIARYLYANPNVPVEQAIFQAAPQVIQDHWKAQGAQEQHKRTNEELAASIYGPDVGPSGNMTPEYSKGETMAQSLAAVMAEQNGGNLSPEQQAVLRSL